jgi:hypothetical protein
MGVNYFVNNIKALSKNNSNLLRLLPDLYQNIDQLHNIKIQQFNNKEIVKFVYKSKEYLTNSKYDSKDEIELLLSAIDFSKDSIIFVSGLGNGEHLFEIKERMTKDSIVFIYEPNQDLIKYILSHKDMTPIFGDAPFLLLTGNDDVISALLLYYTQIFYRLAYNIQTVILPNYYVYNEQNIYILQKIRERITHILQNFGNSLEDMFMGIRNSYKNIDAYFNGNSINEIRGKYKGMPAVIVSAGPSLDKNINLLKKAYGKALIIANDASLDACKKQGVIPDVVSTIERVEATYKFYYKDKSFDEKIVLASPGNIWPEIYKEFPNKRIVTERVNYGIDEWWRKFFEDIEFMDQGHSCATVAFAVAKEAGCNPIILIGQDLAYSEGKIHSKLTHTKHEGDNNDRNWDGHHVKGINGETLRSSEVYILFKKWFEYKIVTNPDLKVIDATEGGAYIEGSEVMTFKEAIDKYCIKDKGKYLIEYLQEIETSTDKKISTCEKIIDSIDEIKSEINKIQEMTLEYFKELEEIKENTVFEDCSMKQLEKIVIKMQKGNTIISDINNIKNIEFFFRQLIKQTVLHVKKIGNELNAENVKRNHSLQIHLMYMISGSCSNILEEFNDMESFLKCKLKEYRQSIA